ncbi:CHAT domain-containing protein [Thermoleptolyngbya sp. C42_A2020_037]|uniref:ABC transporter substrate-binding protein n=1 Tax=Thermoleptolyngbya sp. C42_A2020_037 TaxID=2747799 RepID=UPI0019EA6076|nr:CHAT domain-containing protein [Thermoleptolyngbya sp. C42_A2020_037]MBF2084196.1 ABC transporter substrate-binding protein [Thermoleptolyngbya sp. C42_A2020_037]
METIKLTLRPRDEDNPAAGYRVRLDSRDLGELEAVLPPMPDSLLAALSEWKAAYAVQEGVRSHFRISGVKITHHTAQDVIRLSERLQEEFNEWLNDGNKHWRELREALIPLLRRNGYGNGNGYANGNGNGNGNGSSNGNVDRPLLIIDLGNDDTLKRLPWQDWKLLRQHYYYSDAAIRVLNPTTALGSRPSYPQAAKIRILVIVGESDDISTDQDLAAIQQLEHDHPDTVEVISLLQPSPATLQAALEDPQGFHIMVYVGHSRSDNDGNVGWLLLNQTDEISIRNFKFALSKLVRKGLQLAIFNSCDGLGLAQQLAQIDVPRCIVMKEPVPDPVAVEFLQRFFHEFATKKRSLLMAMRSARQGLEHFNLRYSEVTWLPTVCIKQNAEPLTWQLLLDHLQPKPVPPPPPVPPTPVRGDPPIQPPVSPIPANRRKWILGAGTAAVLLGAIALVSLRPVRCLFVQCEPPGMSNSQGLIGTAGQGNPSPTLLPNERLITPGGNANLLGSLKLEAPYAALKQAGINAFATGDYNTAKAEFDELRERAEAQRQQFSTDSDSPQYKNATAALQDPEVRIFRNNAEVRLRRQAGEPTYTIAAVVPLSEPNGTPINIGKQMLFGIAQAQDQAVNRTNAPINLEVIIANDLNVPAQSRAIAEALVQPNLPALDGQPLLAVIGNYTSRGTCDSLPVYAAAKQVVISPLSTVMNLRARCNGADVFFRITSSTQIEARTLAEYLHQQKNQPRVAVFANSQEFYSNDLRYQFESELRGTIVRTFDLSDPQFDATDALRQVEDVDALVVLPDGRTGNSESFNRALAVIKADGGRRLILASAPVYTADWSDRGSSKDERLALSNRLIVATDWFAKCAPDFDESANRYWLGRVNRITAVSYEAIEVLLPKFRPGVTSDEIRQGLATAQAPSSIFPGKTISFDERGDRKDLTTRVLTTLVDDPANPFDLVPGTACP